MQKLKKNNKNVKYYKNRFLKNKKTFQMKKIN